jgi:outer membrane protein assembly factor BamB
VLALCAVLGAFGVPPAGAEQRGPVITAPGRAERPPVPVDSVSRDTRHDWPKYCGNLEMTGVAPNEHDISPSSAPSLRQAWRYVVGSAIGSSPTVVARRVYVGDWSGTEWAFDAATGAVLATAHLGTTYVSYCNPDHLGITSAAAFSGGVLYLAGGDDAFYALDAKDLSILWRTSLGDNSQLGGYYGWCSPAVAAGRVYQGISSNCDVPFVIGRLDAMDPASGTVVTSTELSPTDQSHQGSGIWTSPAVDLAAGKIFATTGSAYHYDDGLAFSIVRFSIAELAAEDHWKLSPSDFALAADADWGSSPTLFSDSAGTPLVGAGQKNGYYYAFRRTDLAAGPVWQTPIAVPGPCPQCAQGTISTAAFDGNRLYVGGGAIAGFSAMGSVSALDPGTGAVVWSTPLGGPVIAPVSYANGVVFAAGGKSAFALDADTGTILWHADFGSALFGGIAISRGRIFFGDTTGHLYAYEVPPPSD